jgi:hypothetical protein
MISRLVKVIVLVAVITAVINAIPDIKRYLEIRKM